MNRRNPYKLFDYYTAADADVFFGREAEVGAVVGDILANKLLVLFARSGSGKTSLLNAGIGPALGEIGRLEESDPGLQMITIRLSADITPAQSALDALRETLKSEIPPDISTLHAALRHLCGLGSNTSTSKTTGVVLVYDQFEELFISLFKDKPEVRQQFAEQLAQIIHDNSLRAYIVLSLRSDHFHHLNEFRSLIPSIFQNNTNLELKPFDDAAALRVIRGPADRPDSGFGWEMGLPEKIVADLKDLNEDHDGILPIHIQIVCHGLWETLAPYEILITRRHYENCLIKARAADADYASPAQAMIHSRILSPLAVFKGKQRRDVVRVLRELVTKHHTKAVRTLAELSSLVPEQRLQPILAYLERQLLLRAESGQQQTWYELRHDYLALAMMPWLEQQERAIKSADQRRWAGIILLLVLAAVLGTKLWIDWHSYEADINAKSPEHPDELLIKRHPALGVYKPEGWKLEVMTGFMRQQLQAGGVPRFHFEVPEATTSWSEVEPHLDEQTRWALQLATRTHELVPTSPAGTKQENNGQWLLFEVEGHRDIGLYAAIDPRILTFLRAKFHKGSLKAKPTIVSALGEATKFLNAQDTVTVVGDLRLALKDPHAEVRLSASYALGNIPQSLDPATTEAVVDELLLALKEAEPGVNYRIADAMAIFLAKQHLDPKLAKAVLGKLLKAVQPTDTQIKTLDGSWKGYLAQVISRFPARLSTNSAQAVVDDLLGAIEDTDADVRWAARRALGSLAESSLNPATAQTVVDRLQSALNHPNSAIKIAAIQTLGDYATRLDPGTATRVIGSLQHILHENSLTLKMQTALALSNYAKSLNPITANAVAGILQNALKQSNNIKTKYSVFPAFGNLLNAVEPATAKAVLNDLFTDLKDSKAVFDNPAIPAFRTMSQSLNPGLAKSVLGNLLSALKSTDYPLNVNAAEALKYFAQSLNPSAVPAVVSELRNAVTDPSDDVRRSVISTLGIMANSFDPATAQAVIGDLRPALKDNNLRIVAQAAETLGKFTKRIDPGTAQEIVEDLRHVSQSSDLGSNNANARNAAILALGQFAHFLAPPSAQALADDLFNIFKEDDANLKGSAALTLLVIAPFTRDSEISGAALLLAEAYSRERADETVARATRNLAQAVWPISTPALITWLASDDSKQRLFAAQVLAQRPLDTTMQAQIHTLREDSRPWVKMAALRCLVEIEREKFAAIEDALNQDKARATGEIGEE